MNKKISPVAAAFLLAGVCAAAHGASPAPPLADWPHISSAIKRDKGLEARVEQIVASMSLRQKIGQMTQAEIG